MKQTAVEWLFSYMFNPSLPQKEQFELLEQAKEMDKEQKKQMFLGLLDWMNKVAQDNPMIFETDSEDIVDMYLRVYYGK